MTRFSRNSQGGAWRRFRRGVWLKAVLLGLLVVGAKWGWIARFASDTPYMDQWSGEAETLYAPMMRDGFSWHLLFKPHNEHHIAPTKALAAGLFVLGDHQWEPRVEAAASALVHGLFFVLLAAWTLRRLSPRWHPMLMLLFAAIGCLPFAYENTLNGFQSQMYFVMVFGWIAATGLIFAPCGSMHWWLGALAGVIADFSFSAGGLFGVSVIATITVRAVANRSWRRSETWTMLVGIALVALAWTIRGAVPVHAALRADSWTMFSRAVMRLIAWPDVAGPIGSVILWGPLILVGTQLVSGRLRPTRIAVAACFLGVFAASQIGTFAVFRAADVLYGTSLSRYLDLLSLGLVGGVLAVIVLAAQPRVPREWRAGVVLVWATLAMVGLFRESWQVMCQDLDDWRSHAVEQRAHLRAFLRTGDATEFADRMPYEIGTSDPRGLAATLRLAELRPVLPSALQDGVVPVTFLPATGFRPGGVPAQVVPSDGMAVWGDWNSPSTVVDREATSLPFVVTRDRAEISFAISPHRGRVIFELAPTAGDGGLAFQGWGVPAVPVEWLKTVVQLEPGEYRLRVHDQRPTGWTAVSGLRAMSALNEFVEAMLDQAGLLFGGAGIALVFSLWWPLRWRPRRIRVARSAP